jgi:hypothetical protein
MGKDNYNVQMCGFCMGRFFEQVHFDIENLCKLRYEKEIGF